MMGEYGVYDTVYLRFIADTFQDATSAQERADELTASTGRAHEVRPLGVGASETAYFVATGPTFATDGTGHEVTLVADPRHGDLPAWVSILAGDVVVDETAGTCAFSVAARSSIDYSETTPADAPDGIYTSIGVKLNGNGILNGPGESPDVAADGEEVQVTGTVRDGGLIPAAGTIVVKADAYNTATTIDDAVATPSVALTITRIAQAAELPE